MRSIVGLPHVKDRPLVTVYHFGIFGERPGGMAQVVNEFLRWDLSSIRLVGVLTTRRKRDPLMPLLTFLAFLRVLAIYFRNTPSLAVFHLSEKGSFLREGALLRFASLLNVACVAHLHGAEFEEFAQGWPRTVKGTLSAADAVVVLTERSHNRVAGILDRGSQIERVSNFVRVPEVEIKNKSNLVVFGGELGTRKGFDVLVRAWNKKPRPGWKLIAAGPYSDLDLKDVDRSIDIRGPISHAALLDLLDTAKVAVLPSRAEALPLFLLEAMARSCAVVSTGVGQVASLLEDEAGIIVEVDDAEALSIALSTVIADEGWCLELGSRGKTRIVEEYSIAVGRAKMTELWQRAARRPRGCS